MLFIPPPMPAAVFPEIDPPVNVALRLRVLALQEHSAAVALVGPGPPECVWLFSTCTLLMTMLGTHVNHTAAAVAAAAVCVWRGVIVLDDHVGQRGEARPGIGIEMVKPPPWPSKHRVVLDGDVGQRQACAVPVRSRYQNRKRRQIHPE